MRGKSARLQWERVEAARRQAREELGDDLRGGLAYGPPRKATPIRHVEAGPATPAGPADSVWVLTLGEAAARLRLSRTELERMIAGGKVETLTAGLTRVISVREIERLAKRLPTSSSGA